MAFRLLVVSLLLSCFAGTMQAQTPFVSYSQQSQRTAKPDQKKAERSVCPSSRRRRSPPE
jgi:hypothetical protein